MITATDARTVDATIPNPGAPRRLSLPTGLGKRPAGAAPRGIPAVTSVQPLSAPRPDTITTAAMTLPHAVPPNIASTAVENGALVSASVSFGRTPKTATSASTYT